MKTHLMFSIPQPLTRLAVVLVHDVNQSSPSKIKISHILEKKENHRSITSQEPYWDYI